MEEYQESFEELKAFMVAKHRALDENYFTSSFISGLKEDISNKVLLLYPTTLNQAFSMAKMQESIIDSPGRKAKSFPKTYSNGVTNYSSQTKAISLTPSKPLTPITTKASSTTTQPIKWLSYAEMRTRREKGLCYNCDKMFKPGNRCK